jgi:arylsulfatase
MTKRIDRRQFLQTGAAALAVGASPMGARPQDLPHKPWNVLYVISDQHQAACMGAEGHPQAITPNMDSVARRGVRFASAYTQNPICTPSRTSILSGQYVHNHGYYGLSGPPPTVDLPSVLQQFRRNGYRTGIVGKVHTPDEPTNWLAGHCDTIVDICTYHGENGGEGKPYGDFLDSLGLRGKDDSGRIPELPGNQQNESRPSNLPYRASQEGFTVTETIRFMDESGDRPFFAMASLPRPHECYTPDRKFWDMYPEDLALPPTIHNSAAHRPPHFQAMVEKLKNQQWYIEPRTFEAGCRRVWRGYLACITQVDYALGELLSYLQRTGKDANTIIVYGTDHGAYEGTFGVPEKAPGICSEAVCRVPMLWYVPGVTGKGLVSRQFVENIDITPTLLSLCGLPSLDTTDGHDITPLLKGEDKPLREVAVTENVWSKALRWGPYRFVHYPKAMFGSDVGELYNLEKDPDETTNLYHDPASQAIVAECRKQLIEWLTMTTRYVTVLPAPAGLPPSRTALLAPDGKESNKVGVEERIRRGRLNYI